MTDRSVAANFNTKKGRSTVLNEERYIHSRVSSCRILALSRKRKVKCRSLHPQQGNPLDPKDYLLMTIKALELFTPINSKQSQAPTKYSE